MARTTDTTRTGLRNISSAPSQLSRARKQAKAGNCVVGWITEFGAQIAYPTDSSTGDIWPVAKIGVESLWEAEQVVTMLGWKFEELA